MINNGTVSVSGSDAKNRLVVGMIFDQINNFKTKIDKPMIRRMPRNMLKRFFIFFSVSVILFLFQYLL